MSSRVSPARRWAGVVGAVVLAVGVLAAPAYAQQHDEHGHGEDRAAGILPPGDWTEQQIDEAIALVERAEADLPAFADVTKLPALGFYNFGVTAPGGWDHWINDAWMDDGHLLDPKFPESLVFQQGSNGERKLVAAMFFLPTGAGMDDIPEEVAWYPGWHEHAELCVDDNGRFAGLVNSNGTCTVGHKGMQRPMMHVWIVDSPCGHRFAGVGVGGVSCGDHHGPPVLPPGTWPPGTGIAPPGSRPTPPGPGPQTPPPGSHDAPAPRPTPVRATPRYAG